MLSQTIQALLAVQLVIDHQCKIIKFIKIHLKVIGIDKCLLLHFSSSNFKRQNTIDSATIKENTARLAAQNARPTSAQPKPVSSIDNSKLDGIHISMRSHSHFFFFCIFSFIKSSETKNCNKI